MACPNCGSWSVRSDRSLAGRMVCGRCGSPLVGNGAQARRSRSKRRSLKQTIPALSTFSPGWWGLIALLALGAGLAWLEPPQGRQASPLPGWGFDSRNLLPQTKAPSAPPAVWQTRTAKGASRVVHSG